MTTNNSIGFIGLGMMGVPMIENLINKTPKTTKFYIFDVVEEAVKEVCDRKPDRTQHAKSSREVAEKTVCQIQHALNGEPRCLKTSLGCHILNGARGIPSSLRVLDTRDGGTSSRCIWENANRLLDN